MTTPYLTDEEIAAITAPLTQAAARCRHIEREFGLKVRRKPNGQPIVGREDLAAALASRGRKRGAHQPAQAPGNVVTPDWDGLRRKVQSRVR